jgi:predicted SprT family Zn-dependent metalloprotease
MTKKERLALKSINFDLFQDRSNAFQVCTGSTNVDAQAIFKSVMLPGQEELYQLYSEFNQEIFHNRLPEVKLGYSRRMLIAGIYIPSKREIRIGEKYHKIFPEDLEDTLKHEMIHIIYPNHNREFKNLARRLGVSLKAKEHPSLRSYRYLYACPCCGKEYPRRKQLRMSSCADCTPGREYDPRFKLKLVKSSKCDNRQLG